MSDTAMAQRPRTVPPARVLPVLRLLATSDLHCQLLPWDHHADRPAEGQGLSRLASLIAAARAEVPVSVLLDNGDFLTGGPLSEDLAERGALGPDAPHPMVVAMSALGYDAVGLGNHEFSLGCRFLRDSLQAARFPVLSANLLDPAARPIYAPSLLIERSLPDGNGRPQPLRIGVTSVLPPQTVVWEQHNLGGRVVIAEMRAAVAAEVARLRAAGAEVVVVLAHSGLEPLNARAETHPENAARAIAGLRGVDAVIAGHSHDPFPAEGATADGTRPVVLPGSLGSHLGVIDLTLTRRGGRWRVIAARAELRAVARRGADGRLQPLVGDAPEIVAQALPSHEALRARAARVVGETAVRLDSHFALVRPSVTLGLVARAMVAHVAAELGPVGRPVLAAVAPARAGGRGGPDNYSDIPPGVLRMRHLSDVLPHPDRIVALDLTVAELTLWLERSASLFHRIAPGSRDAPLINADVPPFTFDVIPGLAYQIDLAAPARFSADGVEVDPAARRIGALRLQGQPLDPDARVILATSSHRARGGGGFGFANAARVVLEGQNTLREVMLAHVAHAERVVALPGEGWSFRPMPGTTALFESAPDARAPDAAIEPLGLSAGGFRRFRLHL